MEIHTESRNVAAPAANQEVDHDKEEKKPAHHKNVGVDERAVSIAAGSILAALGTYWRSLPGLLIAGVGGALIHRGVTGHCYAYDSINVDTAKDEGIHVEQALLIDRPREELYSFWRDFTNLPRVMRHLERVEILGDRKSRWVAKIAEIGGHRLALEWEAELTSDERNERIAWHTIPGSSVENKGDVRFVKGVGNRGTEVHVSLDYMPPAGRLGHWVATVFGKSPWQQIREDLRSFKRLMETGEIPTIDGQPHGTCTGEGEYYHERNQL